MKNFDGSQIFLKMLKFIGAIFAGFFIGIFITIMYSLIVQIVTEKRGDEIMNEIVTITYEQISQIEAKNIMDTESNFIILDVRTEEEFAEGHIKDAILIPDYEIASKAEEILKDKNQLILVYCRSGRRSKIAAEALVNLGYINVKEFGGIIDWEYGIVKN